MSEQPSNADHTPNNVSYVTRLHDASTRRDAERRAAARQRARAARRRAARTAHRAQRTWIALLFFPGFIAYLIIDAVREVRDYVRRMRHADMERFPAFRRPSAMAPLDQRSMADITSVIDGVPWDPIRLPAALSFFRDNGPDALGALLSNNPQITTIPHLYPHTFTECLLRGADDVPLAGMKAMHEHRGPAVVICHGLLMTKNFDVIIQLARRAFEVWGFHVVTMDLRGWGQSGWTTDSPASGGYWEGRDLVEVCRDLHQDELVTSVAAIGFSLGGASVLNAAHASSLDEDHPIDGGSITISAPTDIGEALRYISTRPAWTSPFFGLWNVFRATIKGTVRKRRLRKDIRSWIDLVEEVSCKHYGITMDEFAEQASPVRFADQITQPVLALHSDDDFVVPIEHATELRDVTAENPWVHVVTKPYGAHCSFSAVDSRWYHSVMRRWLEYWATPGAVAEEIEDLDAPLGGHHDEHEIGA